jgi:lysophospholipase L1-like esterase
MFSFFKKSVPVISPTYCAIGDSIISDCYPGVGLGAASLVYRNNRLFADFEGRDLATLVKGIAQINLSKSGFTLVDVQNSLKEHTLPSQIDFLLMSVGGNDCLQGMLPPTIDPDSDQAWKDWRTSYVDLIQGFKSRWPKLRIAVCNLYDPTDGTGQLQSQRARNVSSPTDVARTSLLSTMNRLIQQMAQENSWSLVNLHQHFAGHGTLALDAHARATSDFWFQRDIEPSQRGASEVRRKILESWGF